MNLAPLGFPLGLTIAFLIKFWLDKRLERKERQIWRDIMDAELLKANKDIQNIERTRKSLLQIGKEGDRFYKDYPNR